MFQREGKKILWCSMIRKPGFAKVGGHGNNFRLLIPQ